MLPLTGARAGMSRAVKPAAGQKDMRERIAEAALDILEREGPEAVSMRRVAQAVGVTAMALYHHYANREALLQALVYREFDRLDRAGQATPRLRAGAAPTSFARPMPISTTRSSTHTFTTISSPRRARARCAIPRISSRAGLR